ncbi:MAG: ArsR/SmtB family transcription factor [Thermoplasmata archaeon]
MRDQEACKSEFVNEKKVKRIGSQMLDDDAFHKLSETFKGLGDGTRIRILYALSKGELCVCELATLLGSSVSAISHQLRTLRSLGFVRNRREGKSVCYSLYDQHVRELLNTTIRHLRE